MKPSHRHERGSALLLVMIMSVSIAILLTGLLSLTASSAAAALGANERISRLYAAEAGLERAKMLVSLNTTDTTSWLDDNVGGGPVILDGNTATTLTVGDCTVQVEVTSLAGGWAMVTSTATDHAGRRTLVSMTARPRTYFSDYARFVSDNSLSIGSNASYDGKVHSNGNINCYGSNITFYDNVTASGSLNPRSDTTFMKDATGGVPQILLPEASELEDLCQDPPAGSLQYDWDDASFQAAFQAATGKTPNNTLRVYVEFNRNVMTVQSKCYVGGTWYTMTESNIDVPDKNAIYIRGTSYVEGNLSRRTSIICPKDIYIENSVRYVDDSGGPLWELRDKTSGNLAGFSTSDNTWTPTDNWKDTSDYSYEMASDWWSRAPVDTAGDPLIPALGIVSGDTIYLKGSENNREIHAALFTSGDVVRPNTGTSSKRKNLHIHGAIITTGTNPLSGDFSYRCYAYDPNLRLYPPPGFPTMVNPTFRNWHVSDEVN